MADLQADLKGIKKDIFSFARRIFGQRKKIKVPKGHMTKYMGGYLKKKGK